MTGEVSQSPSRSAPRAGCFENHPWVSEEPLVDILKQRPSKKIKLCSVHELSVLAAWLFIFSSSHCLSGFISFWWGLCSEATASVVQVASESIKPNFKWASKMAFHLQRWSLMGFWMPALVSHQCFKYRSESFEQAPLLLPAEIKEIRFPLEKCHIRMFPVTTVLCY